MATIADVAQRAGVGVGTVSRVLNDSPLVSDRTRARVLAIIEEMDYRPSQLARGLSIGTAGVLAAVVQRMTTPSAFLRLRGILDVASSAGYDVILHNVDRREDYRGEVRDLLRPDRCAGGLLVSVRPDDDDVKRLADNPVPAVIVDGRVAGLTSLFIDDERGGQIATEHLIELGHERIAFIGDWENDIGFRPTAKRRAGFHKAMANAGYDVPDYYVRTGPYKQFLALTATNELLDLDDPPTAVVCSADANAMVVAQGARARGIRVPEDLSIVGYDDLEIAEHLGITTVRQPLYESGARGARLLLEKMDADTRSAQHVELPIELIARDSTSPPGKSA